MPTQEQLAEMYQWYQQRKEQQLSYPVDEASRNALRAVEIIGASTINTTQTVNISVNPATGLGTLSIPATPAGFIVIGGEGAQYAIPYYV